MIKYLLSFCIFFSSVSYADCPQKVQVIDKGQVASCDGYLFSDEAEKEASKAKRDAEFYKSVNDLLTRKTQLQTKENDILERRLNLYMNQSNVLAQEVAKRDNTDSLYRMGYFILGVVVTGYIAANVSR